jgi:hypothetical protein
MNKVRKKGKEIYIGLYAISIQTFKRKSFLETFSDATIATRLQPPITKTFHNNTGWNERKWRLYIERITNKHVDTFLYPGE